MPCIEERLDSEPVARGKESLLLFIPDDEGKLTAQTVQALWADLFIQMQRDLTICTCTQPVTARFKLQPNLFILVKLAIDDDVRAVVFAGDGLVAGGEIDDAQARVAEADAVIAAYPLPLAIGPTVMQRLRRAFEYLGRYRRSARVKGRNSTHVVACSWFWRIKALPQCSFGRRRVRSIRVR